MTETEIRQIVENQRTYFYTGSTLPLSHRIEALKKIQSYILTHEAEIGKAIRKDLGKSDFESYMCETGLVLSEITYMLKHIRSLQKRRMYSHHWHNFTPEVLKNRRRTVSL